MELQSDILTDVNDFNRPFSAQVGIVRSDDRASDRACAVYAFDYIGV